MTRVHCNPMINNSYLKDTAFKLIMQKCAYVLDKVWPVHPLVVVP